MARYSGKDGVVRIGSNAIASIKSFTCNTNFEPIVRGELGDVWDDYIDDGSTTAKGKKKWEASFECNYDDADATGQDLLVEGEIVALELYPIGVSSGLEYLSGNAIVTSIQRANSDGEPSGRSYSVVGKGALTTGNQV